MLTSPIKIPNQSTNKSGFTYCLTGLWGWGWGDSGHELNTGEAPAPLEPWGLEGFYEGLWQEWR